MDNVTHSGLATTWILLGVVVLVILGAGGWYFTRQQWSQPTPVTTSNVPETVATSRVAQSQRTYMLRSDAFTKSYQPKIPTSYIFSITDDQGNTEKDFSTVHEKLMHVIVVRKDLAEFQHVHPEFNQQTGQFTLAHFIFPSDGQYRIFTDFTPMSAQRGGDGQPLGVTIHEDVNVGNLSTYKPRPLVNSQRTRSFQNYTVQLVPSPTPITAAASTTLSFDITQNGRSVTNVEKYLGALGHTVVLREEDLAFLHTHAVDEDVDNQTGMVDFSVTFPTAATYKIFSQFQHQGKVMTTDFVVTVERTSAGMNEGNEPLSQQDHSLPNIQH